MNVPGVVLMVLITSQNQHNSFERVIGVLTVITNLASVYVLFSSLFPFTEIFRTLFALLDQIHLLER